MREGHGPNARSVVPTLATHTYIVVHEGIDPLPSAFPLGGQVQV
jgi:hypothetical protein